MSDAAAGRVRASIFVLSVTPIQENHLCCMKCATDQQQDAARAKPAETLNEPEGFPTSRCARPVTDEEEP